MLTLIKQNFWNKKINIWYKSKCLLTGLLVINCVYANPEDGVVSAGQATINSQPNYTEITQQSERAVIDWGKFDIGSNEHTNFVQPSSNSVTLNRIHSDESSNINGQLTANGKLILINQNGIMFGKDAKVDVNGLLATSSNIANQQFMRGIHKQRQLLFDQAGSADAAIVNEGEINAAKGLVGLVAPKVLNTGVIIAKLGKVALATGDHFTVDLYGDRLLNIAVSDEQRKQLLINSGKIIADGGEILLTGSAGKKIVNNLIINSGALAARSVEECDGKIIIFAEGSNAVKGNINKLKGKKQGQSGVLVKGLVDVSGLNLGERGGKLQISGDEIVITDAIINASGYEGKAGTTVGLEKSAKRIGSAGGEILIGGDYLGKGKLPAAQQLLVDRNVVIFNDAIEIGDAGRNIFWSDGSTSFNGKVFARALGGKKLNNVGADSLDLRVVHESESLDLRSVNGYRSAEEIENLGIISGNKYGSLEEIRINPILGGNPGDGGFVETSGKKKLEANGYVNLLASNGFTGTYLLDPSAVNIYGNFDPKFVSTDGTINLQDNLKIWLDFTDKNQIQLIYNGVLNGVNEVNVTANGSNNSNTLTVNNATYLKVGASIKLGLADSNTVYYASYKEPDVGTNGSNIYTITAINGNNLTVTPNLKAEYTNVSLNQGYISKVYDKSGGNNNAATVQTSRAPLWLDKAYSNYGGVRFDRGVEFLSVKTDGVAESAAMDYIKYQSDFTYMVSYYLDDATTYNNMNMGALFSFYSTTSGYPSNTGAATYYTVKGNWNGRLWFYNHNGYPYNNYYSTNGAADYALNSPNLAYVYDQRSANKTDLYINGNLLSSNQNPYMRNGTPDYTFNIGSGSPNYHYIGAHYTGVPPSVGYNFYGNINSVIEYNKAVTEDKRSLLEQYQNETANFQLPANPVSSYAAGVNGSTSFTTWYLKKLSDSANITILADNIQLDLQNSTLTLSPDKNLNITARSSLQVLSLGSITTTRTTIGGNINIQLDNGNIDLSKLNLNALNGGEVNIGATLGGITVGTINAGSILINAQGSNSDVIIPSGKNLTSTNISNHPLILVAGRNFYNNNPVGSTVLTTANDTYWRIYSTSPINNIGISSDHIGSREIKSNISYDINAVPTDLSNLLIYSGDARLLEIAPNISSVHLIYGDPLANIINQITSYTYTGYIAPDIAANDTITGSPSITSNYNQGSNIGYYDITISKGTLQSALNYDFPTKTITEFVQVTPKLLTLDLTGEVVKTYDGTLDATLTTSNYTNIDANAKLSNEAGVVGSDIVNLTGYSNGYYVTKDVDVEKTITVSSLGVDNSNYSIGNTLSGNIGTINPKELHIAANPASKIYGDSDPILGYSVTTGDLVAGETVDIIQGELTRADGNNVGTYPITISSTNPISAPNYSIVYTGAAFTINPITISISDPNYEFNLVSGEFTIYPRPITVTADAITKTYGDVDPNLSYHITAGNLIGSDSLNISLSRVDGENVVNSPYTISFTPLSNPNYNLTYVPGNFTITSRPISITPNPATTSKTYGDSEPILSYQVTAGNMVGTDNLNVSLTRAIGENVANSPYAINLTGVVNPNYNLTYVPGNFIINPRAITVTANPVSKTYGNSDPALTYNITTGNLVGTDNLSGSLTRIAGENVSGSPYIINIGSLSNSNYTLNYNSANFTITPRPLAIQADSLTKTYGDQDPTLTYQITAGSLLGSDKLNGRLKRVAGEEVAGSPYAINLGTLSNANYSISYNSANFNILPKVFTVRVDPVTKIYGDPDPAFTYKIEL